MLRMSSDTVLATAHRYMALREADQKRQHGLQPQPAALSLVATDRVHFGVGIEDRSKAASDWRVPMAEVRLLGQSHGLSMNTFILQQDAVIWDGEKQQFALRLDFYNNDKMNLDPGRRAFERALNHGEVLPGTLVAGAIVDQVNKRVILPDGRWIDGPTGNIYSLQGDLLIAKNPKEQPGVPEGKSL